ncbi:MAG: hemerythrin domain-containing protein [Deltaproteobacteria bacterium]|nr:hemerythrin domain-containing protein [Deltaproteobacteria bacterium]
MEAIEILMEEHRLIEKGLDAMEAWVTTLGSGSEPDDKAELARFVSFIRDFGDTYHHAKEENILFVAMVDHGFPREAGPIAVMLHEHDKGRSLVRTLDVLAQQATTWSEDDYGTLAHTAREFASLLRGHIQKEDQILYPMASTRLPEPVQQEILRRFQDLEKQQTSSGEHERLRALAASLIEAHVKA